MRALKARAACRLAVLATLGVLFAAPAVLAASAGRNDLTATALGDSGGESAAHEPAAELRARVAPASGPYVHTFAAVGYGRGLRFNNPYRLQTELGNDAESPSLTSGYADLGLGAALGDADGFQHGVIAHLSLATTGVRQEVLSLSYVLLRPFGDRVLAFARAGVPFVLEPDFSSGGELGLGGVYFFSGGLGLNAEAVMSVFAGAGTWDHDPTFLPILSLQLGVFASYEVLP